MGRDAKGKEGAGDRPARLEAWVRAVFLLGILATLVLLLLGLRSRAPWHRALYRVGPLAIGLLGSLGLAYGLGASLWRRPVLQRGRVAAYFTAAACILVGSIPFPYPSPYASRPSGLPFRLPFEGEWVTRFGGEGPFRHPLQLSPDRRFGFEFRRPGPDGSPGPRTSVGARVLAPLAGEVTAVDPLPGDPPGAPEARVVLVLRVAEDRWVLVGGLDPAQVAVKPGQKVTSGEPLGVVGAPPAGARDPVASLRIDLQDDPRPGHGLGVPMRFGPVLVEGERRDRVVPAGGVDPGHGAGGWRVQPGS